MIRPVTILLVLLETLPARALEAPREVAPTEEVAASEAIAPDSDEPLPFKLSLPTEEDEAAWLTPGFRLQFGLGYGFLHGLGGAPSWTLVPFQVRIGTRLDNDWSVFGNFQFSALRANNASTGLRFAGTIDPTWHITDHLDVALGLGFGGLVESSSTRVEPNADQRNTLVAPYTFPDASTPLTACSGIGVASHARAAYLWALGPLSTSGVAMQIDGQWTACVDTIGAIEPDTARPITRRQWWGDMGGSFLWVVGWR